MISGAITIVAFASFIGITAWAWSRSNRERFLAAAQLPLDDDGHSSACGSADGAP